MATICLSKHENTNLDAFMDEFHSSTAAHPFSPHLAVFENCVVFEVKPFSGLILFGLIQTLNKGQGDGSRALQWLIDLADKHQVTLTGNVQRVGDEGLTVNQLRRWYKRYGFNLDRRRHLEMQRPPKQMEDG